MKRLYQNNITKRVTLNSLNSKIYKLTNSFDFGFCKNKVYSQCFFSYSTKNVFKKFHLSSKSFKYLSSYGLLPGVKRYTW